MVLREITSRENPAVKEYVRLAGSRKARRETGRFVTEGVKLTAEAFNAGCTPRAAYVLRKKAWSWLEFHLRWLRSWLSHRARRGYSAYFRCLTTKRNLLK